jgi:hypothetical protein
MRPVTVLNRTSFAFACVLAALVGPQAARAQLFDVTGSNGGYSFHATVVFTHSGNDFHVVLTNLSQSPTNDNSQVLTAVFWKGGSSLYGKTGAAPSSGSVVVTDNNTTYTGSQTAAQHWGYTNAGPSGYTQGLGASGLNWFGPSTAFQSGGTTPVIGGADWGLIQGNPSGIGGNQSPFVRNSMTFDLNTLDITKITGVDIQWGTSTSEFHGTSNTPQGVTPEGGSLAMLCCGLIPIAGLGLRSRRRASA